MAKKKEVTVEEKLRALYDLQLIDSRKSSKTMSEITENLML